MGLGLLLRIAAIYTALAGLGIMFAPQELGAGAVPADASAALIAHLRVLSSPLLGIAVLDWAARNAEPSKPGTPHHRKHLDRCLEQWTVSPSALRPCLLLGGRKTGHPETARSAGFFALLPDRTG